MRLLTEFIQDCRYGIRQLFQHPALTIVTVLMLGLGIGATTAIFSVINSVILRPLPVAEPERLVTLSTPFRANAGLRTFWSYSIWEQIRSNAQPFDGAFAWSAQRFNLSDRGEAEPAEGIFASSEYFATLGVPALIGRTFRASDDVRGGGPDGPVAIVSYGLWQRRFGGTADIVGRRLLVEGEPFTIIGVMPRGFFGTEVGRPLDIALPLGAEPSIHGTNPALSTPGWYWLNIMLRLKPGQSLGAANATLHILGREILPHAVIPFDLPTRFVQQLLSDPFIATPGVTGVSSMREQYDRPLFILLATVTLLLLIACANVANLLLARATARRHEITVRLALGASRWRLVRQTLTESLILSCISATAGLSIAAAGSRALVAQLSMPANPVFLDLPIDWRVMAFTAGVAIGTAILFGTIPALTTTKLAPIDVLKESGRGTSPVLGGIVSSGLVVAQVALSLVLLVVAGLFIGTFENLAHMPTGYDTNRIAIANVSLLHAPADPAKRLALFRDLVNAAGAASGVEHTAASFVTPVSDSRFAGVIEARGYDAASDRSHDSFINFVTPEWFATYGMTMRSGRDFGDLDIKSGQDVAVVNEAFIRQIFRDRSPIGETVKYSFNGREFSTGKTIVGITSDAVYQSLREGMQPTIYMPIAQSDLLALTSDISISIRSPNPASPALARTVAEALTGIDRDISFTFRPLADQLDASIAQESAIAKLSGWFGAMALVLASVGLYGVMSYAVTRRQAEIGIRIALGATPGALVRMVLGRAFLLVAAGIAIGGMASSWASHFVASLLYGIEPQDTLTLTVSSFVLLIAAAAAVWLPASRASRIDPAVVLRSN